MKNPEFERVLNEMKRIHDLKNEDYADGHNPYSNFEEAAAFAGVTVAQVFAVMVGIKVARLKQLLSGKTPNYESMADTQMDMANYLALWLSYRPPAPKPSMANSIHDYRCDYPIGPSCTCAASVIE